MDENGYFNRRGSATYREEPSNLTTGQGTQLHEILFRINQRVPLKLLVVLLVSLICLGALAFLYPQLTKDSDQNQVAIVEDPEPVVVEEVVETVPSPLTGRQVSEEESKRPVTAVMIENSPEARPQSGLAEADMVFEAIAEAGITRFLALFQETKPESLGPIRSARPYYVSWAAGFDANYVHSGGSSEAKRMIPRLGMRDMDHGRYGTRVGDRVNFRYAPHNVYSSTKKLDTLAKELKYNKVSEFIPFARKADAPVTDPDAKEIDFAISSFNYNSSYTYNPETNDYSRTMAGSKHTDQNTKKVIQPKVVVALGMDTYLHSDGKHQVYPTVGKGDALLFQDGTVTEIKWSKEGDKESLLLSDVDGDSVELNTGQTWLTAINLSRVTYE